MIEHIAEKAAQGMQLSRYIQRAWPMLSARSVRDAFARRDVKVDGVRCGADFVLNAGQCVRIYLKPQEEDFSLRVIFDDGRLMAVEKPQGLPVDTDKDGIGADTALIRAKKIHPQAQLCHRLDSVTGGVLLFAMDDETLAAAMEAFKHHALEKRYMALCRGNFRAKQGTRQAFLFKDAKKGQVRVEKAQSRGALPIETNFRVVKDNGALALVELEPVTGRTHQLRAHMAYLGHPIVGDDRYGDRALNRAHPGMTRLWCKSLCFTGECAMQKYAGVRFESAAPGWNME